jgi:hypothetical protein
MMLLHSFLYKRNILILPSLLSKATQEIKNYNEKLLTSNFKQNYYVRSILWAWGTNMIDNCTFETYLIIIVILNKYFK